MVQVTLDSVLEAGESIVVWQARGGRAISLGTVSQDTNDPSGLTYQVLDDALPSAGVVTYQALVVDAAGWTTPSSPVFAIQIASDIV
ncbi:MAG: hypothetical protein R3E83_10860 [Burkholderiaceae bacterium]